MRRPAQAFCIVLGLTILGGCYESTVPLGECGQKAIDDKLVGGWVQVTDGETSIKKENVQLFGTGNVIGAVDKELYGYTGFVGANEPTSLEDRPSSLKKLPLALVFVAAVGILIALVFVERRLTKKQN